MGLKYLWDTNTVIYYLQKNFKDAELDFLNKQVVNYQPVISAITQIELLSWKGSITNEITIINAFISDSIVLN